MNYYVWFLAVVFGLIETNYFGNNLFPQSTEELICDGITLFLVAIAFLTGR